MLCSCAFVFVWRGFESKLLCFNLGVKGSSHPSGQAVSLLDPFSVWQGPFL